MSIRGWGRYVDWDDLVAKVAGNEGAPRYIRIGAFLFALSFISFLALLFMPLYSSGDQSYSYFDLQDDPQGILFGISNEHVIGLVNLALAGCILTELIALVLILEGKRVINLRRFLVWHAEARATSLYALSAVMATIALAGAASLWGLVTSMPAVFMDGIVAEADVASPGTVVALVMMGLCVLSMLFMTYYNCVLSVYRGGVTPRTRNMARITMLLALVSVAAIIFLRLGIITSGSIENDYGPADVSEIFFFYSSARIGYYGDSAADNPLMASLDFQLGAIQVLMGMALLAALGGAIGVSAHSLGGNSQRVRRTASLPALAIFLVASASFYAMGAAGIASEAVREVLPNDGIPAGLGWGLILSMVLILVGVILTILYFIKAGSEFVVSSFAFWKESKEPEEEAIPSDGVEIFGPDTDGDEPLDVEIVGPPRPPKGPILPKPILMALAVLLVIAIVLAAAVGVAMLRDPTGGNGIPGRTPVDPEELPPFQLDMTRLTYVDEGQTFIDDALMSVLGPPPEDGVYFVKTATASVQWTDEPDANILWTNQPDTFDLEVFDTGNAFAPGTAAGANLQGGQGSINAGWNSAEFWLAWGNLSLVDTGDADVISEGSVKVYVTMVNAGDQTTLLGRTQTDSGNQCTVTMTVVGTYYSITEEGQ